MKNIQKIYEKEYRRVWEKVKGKSPIRIVQHEDPTDDSSPIKKVYEEEGNFFLCGFVNLEFLAKGKNRNLKRELEKQGIDVTKKSWESGYYVGLDKIGNSGNGDYKVQVLAFNAVADYLSQEGYEVDVMARLD